MSARLGRQFQGNPFVEDDGNLQHARPQRHRHRHQEHPLDALRPESADPAKAKPHRPERRQQQHRLQHAGPQHRDAEHVGQASLKIDVLLREMALCLEVQESRPHQNDEDMHQIEDDGQRRRHGEALMNLQNRTQERRSADEQNVGQHDPREFQRQQIFRPHLRVQGDEAPDNRLPQEGDGQENQAKEIDAGGGEIAGLAAVGFLLDRLRVERNKRRR